MSKKTQRPLTRPRRLRGITARLTPDEYDLAARQAETRGLSMAEWMRCVAIAHLRREPGFQVLLEEVLAIRQILFNVISHLATEGAVPSKLDLRAVAERADTAKFQKAEAAFARLGDFVHPPHPPRSLDHDQARSL